MTTATTRSLLLSVALAAGGTSALPTAGHENVLVARHPRNAEMAAIVILSSIGVMGHKRADMDDAAARSQGRGVPAADDDDDDDDEELNDLNSEPVKPARAGRRAPTNFYSEDCARHTVLIPFYGQVCEGLRGRYTILHPIANPIYPP
ncbi:hypothetical protein F5X99DRAFT_411833 [Biscogniauxia marginata]|nr:hypothetical protein F5X99DRAFT_411833 [Biscogniauxia marginata]